MNEQIINPCESCQYLTDKYFHYYQDQVNESAKYTSTIITVGYISLVSMLSQVYKYINSTILILTILCACTSITFFIINEVWNMRLRHTDIKIINEIWNDYAQGKFAIGSIIIQIQRRMQDARKTFLKCYEKIFIITLVSGLLATFSLVLGCSIVLIDKLF